MTKREKWTEGDLDNITTEEQDIFERKAGQLFGDQDKFLNTLAKALSAFANSGGGHIILGADDDGVTYDGLPKIAKGRITMRDWLEMKVPNLVDYPISDFRVHTVGKSASSKIPNDKEVIIIDVGDSSAAPHQSVRDKVYYRREGGRSVPAPHFYLELLRQRLVNPALEATLTGSTFHNAYEPQNGEGIFVSIDLKFDVKNIGRVVANLWQINVRELSGDNVSEQGKDFYFTDFPAPKNPGGRDSSISVGSRAILPDSEFSEKRRMGLHVRPASATVSDVASALDALLKGVSLGVRIATETSPGNMTHFKLFPAIDTATLAEECRNSCPSFFASD